MYTTETAVNDIRGLVRQRNAAERQKIAAAKASDVRGYTQHLKEQRTLEASINEKRNQLVSRRWGSNHN